MARFPLFLFAACCVTSAGLSGSDAFADPPPLTKEEYQVRLADLEAKIEELKGQIRRHPGRHHPPPFGSVSVRVADASRLPIRLESVRIGVDGQPPFVAPQDGAQLNLEPGEHVIRIVARFVGDDRVFSYLRGYTFEVRALHTVRIQPLGATALRATVRDAGDALTPLSRRPTVVFTE